ncbi:transglycosylase domain-containing protein [Thermoactinomyces sp. DSM 45892]|uniref:transglycosylase domain-containing protein n=1 Tax=Thermoactinomyces sp. DSM 45892 TaxID=1882753 RepID=UPI00089AB956|nr:transglycosylase domain-containing protein [Thermoactinomyces sp. DSM 45892]SDY27203.1 penicillin-binding protein [Thermoactinomyces sp. DSM 45892]
MESEKQEKQQPKKGKRILKKLGKTTFIVAVSLLTIAVGAAGVGLGAVQAFTKDEKIRTKADFEETLANFSSDSYVYFGDKDKTEVEKMHRKDSRELIKSSKEVSKHLLDALFATEDREFYQHSGFVPKAILRATWQSAIGMDDASGGSTLTQQLVKREILKNPEKSYQRKAKELIDANRIEKYYSKEEILVSYLNSVFLGNGANNKLLYGFKVGAYGLFNKDIDKLTLPEAAYLVGMVQSPNRYNPNNPAKEADEAIKLGTKRMQLVLKNMLTVNKITQKEYDEAIKADISKSFVSEEELNEEGGMENYPYIMTAVQKEAVDILKDIDKEKNPDRGWKDKQYNDYVRSGGFKIYTTIDKKMYDEMDKAASKIKYNSKSIKGLKKGKQTEQIGAVMVDQKTGEVLSFVGGTDFKKNQKDHAFTARNQPGSAMKPILAYGPALDKGIISPSSIVVDEPLAKRGSSGYYDGSKGPITTTYALEWSRNVPAVKIYRDVLRKLGQGGLFDGYVKKMGIDIIQKDRPVDSLVLGGASVGYTVEEMTGAYSMFANDGVYNETHIIREIRDKDDNIIYQYKPNPVRVFETNTARQLTSMLRGVVTSGTGKTIGNGTGGYNVAGKTGTTTSYFDLWFVGYTPEVTMGVWSGYDYNAIGDQHLAKEAWVKLFKAAAAARPDLIKKGSSFPSGSSRYVQYESGTPVDSDTPSSGTQTNPNTNSNTNTNNQKKEKQQQTPTPQQPPRNNGQKPPGGDKINPEDPTKNQTQFKFGDGGE